MATVTERAVQEVNNNLRALLAARSEIDEKIIDARAQMVVLSNILRVEQQEAAEAAKAAKEAADAAEKAAKTSAP